MKLEVYETSEKEEPTVRLRLVQEDGRVLLAVVGNGGEILESGYIMEFMPGGTFIRCGNLGDYGFQRDGNDRIKEDY